MAELTVNKHPRNSAGTVAVDAIKNFIVSNRLKPCDPLPTETELQSALGVSRSSVREALRTLQSLDIVCIQHGRGMSVGSLSFSPMIEAVLFRAKLNQGDNYTSLKEVIEVRRAVDLMLADELIKHYQGSEQASLLEYVQGMREKQAQGESFAEFDKAFHQELLSVTTNQMLRQLGMAFWEVHNTAVPALGLPQPEDINHTIEAHGAIVDSLIKGDKAAYEAAVTAHYQPLQRLIEAQAEAK